MHNNSELSLSAITFYNLKTKTNSLLQSTREWVRPHVSLLLLTGSSNLWRDLNIKNVLLDIILLEVTCLCQFVSYRKGFQAFCLLLRNIIELSTFSHYSVTFYNLQQSLFFLIVFKTYLSLNLLILDYLGRYRGESLWIFTGKSQVVGYIFVTKLS